MTVLLGVDIGGTFTDCVAVSDEDGVIEAKSLSTRRNPTVGILDGIKLLAESVDLSTEEFLGRVERLSHGTTIGTNLVVERNGARVGLLATRGHGDALSMMRGNGRVAGLPIDQIFDVRKNRKPEALVPSNRIREINERIDKDGNVVVVPQADEIRHAVSELLEQEQVEAIAIVFLWSFRNNQNEREAEAIVREMAPDIFVSVSSEVSPRLGEYERTVATVINAYVGPKSSTYLADAKGKLSEKGLNGPFLIMQSSGGVLPTESAEKNPITIINSGPSGGVIGSQELAYQMRHPNVITTDMGGTSFDVSLIINGETQLTDRLIIDQYTYQLPHVDVRTIAAGGGSIARYDWPTNSLRVGPESAGSEPGPACYGLGGIQPTVTDADVVLGLIRAEGFLGGKMPLDYSAAYKAVEGLANKLNLGVEETAAGIIRINNHAAATVIRQQTIEKALDPRDFVLYAYGGAGPVHAFGFAAELGISEVIIPLGNGASTLSAFGIAQSNIMRVIAEEEYQIAPFDQSSLETRFNDIEEKARREFGNYEMLTGELSFERVVVMRFAGQLLHELLIELPRAEERLDFSPTLTSLFLNEYQRRYGSTEGLQNQSIEISTLRVKVMLKLNVPDVFIKTEAEHNLEVLETRKVLWPSTMERAETRILSGLTLPDNQVIDGPAIIELPQTNICVAPGQKVSRFASSNFRLFVEE